MAASVAKVAQTSNVRASIGIFIGRPDSDPAWSGMAPARGLAETRLGEGPLRFWRRMTG